METSFDLLVWREALVDAAPIPSGRDLAEWAERLEGAGEHEAAALLTDVAALHRGFSPQAIAAGRRSSSVEDPFDASPAMNGGWTLHRALAELRALARLAAPASALPRLAAARTSGPSGRPDNPQGIGDGIPAAPVIGDVAEAARRLRALMENASVNAEELTAALTALVEADRRSPAIDYRLFAKASLDVLAPVIAAVGLVDFALSTRDLWDAPLGSPELFHFTARLDSAGLGPYLDNVGRLARDSRDLADLARVAQSAAKTTLDDPTLWIALLSRRCRRELLYEIVDDLGDADARAALSAVLDRVTSRPAPAIDRPMVMRLRDAGLDNADYVLATRAQQVIVRLEPDNALEGLILGEIEASGGAFDRAEAIFRHWHTRSPDDQELRRRLIAVRGNRFDEFALTAGFGSPADRRDTRLRRRGIPPDYPRRVGERIRAVDVG